uniref:Protein E7 n=1 Tax=Human papillomavirus TaxID=10566 RepID=A0A385PJJ1_9PAPI|nr:MAG: E7 protein [Human papillomavirus]
MQGQQPTIKDICLDLEEIAVATNPLFKDESLSPDTEEEQDVFKIGTHCENCKARVRVCVQASSFGIKCLQHILAADLSFFCPDCSRRLLQHGRSH